MATQEVFAITKERQRDILLLIKAEMILLNPKDYNFSIYETMLHIFERYPTK